MCTWLQLKKPAYFCYYLWVLLHFSVLFMDFTLLFQLIFTFIYNTFNKKILDSMQNKQISAKSQLILLFSLFLLLIIFFFFFVIKLPQILVWFGLRFLGVGGNSFSLVKKKIIFFGMEWRFFLKEVIGYFLSM